jgi:hypothetical protein
MFHYNSMHRHYIKIRKECGTRSICWRSRTVKLEIESWWPYKFQTVPVTRTQLFADFIGDTTWMLRGVGQGKSTGAPPSGPGGSYTWWITVRCRHHSTASWQVRLNFKRSYFCRALLTAPITKFTAYIYVYIYIHTTCIISTCFNTYLSFMVCPITIYRVTKKKCTHSKIYFTKTTDVKSMSCVRMERKSPKVLISMIWSGTSLRLWLSYLWHAATSVGRAGLSIWHLPRHTWGSHQVLVRFENNF